MQPMKLWVDDIRTPPHGWFWARNYTTAIACLKATAVYRISLDHDLGEESRGSGYDIAKWIEEFSVAGLRLAFQAANTVLDSLSKVLTTLEPFKEFKEGTETVIDAGQMDVQLDPVPVFA